MRRLLSLGMMLLSLVGCGSDSNPPAQMTWNSPVLFSGLHQGFQGGRLFVDANDRAMLAWTKDAHVWASTSADTASWNTPEQVDDAVLRAGLIDVSMNASGQAAVMWRAEETTPADYFKVRLYDPVSGWAASPQMLDNLTVDGTGGAVDVNASGDVMSVFVRYGTGDHVWARYYDATSGWDAAATALDTPPSWSNSPDVAIDSAGNATAVWEQWDGTRNRPWTRSYIAGTGWGATPSELDGTTDPDIDKVSIATRSDGDGIAYWTLSDRTGVMARRLVSGNWQAVETIVSDANIYRADAKVAPDGRIVQTWSDGQNVSAKVCAAGVWDTDAFLVSDDAETVGLRSWVMAMDRTNGRVIVMWSRLALNDADGSAIWARRFDPVDGWSPVEEVLPWTPAILFDVDDAVLFDDGRAVAVIAGEDISVWEYSTYLVSYR